MTETTMESTAPPVRDRSTEESRGRWEDRCWNTSCLSGVTVLICDRPTGHRGLHRGRICEASYGNVRVFAYGARK